MCSCVLFSSLCLAQTADGQAHRALAPQSESVENDDENLESAEEAEVIVIVAPAPLEPAAPSARTARQDTLVLTPQRSADDLLRVVPGLHMAQHATEGKAQQFFLRGFDALHGSDLAVSVAGIPINEPSNVHGHGYVDIGFVIPEAVRSVSATKGSFRAFQGDFATAGSVALDLGVDAPRRGYRMSYGLGSTTRHRALALVAPESLPAASFLAIEGMADAGFGQHRASERVTALGQHRIELSSSRYLQVLAAGYAARFDEPGTVPLADFQASAIDFYDTYNENADGASLRGLTSARLRDESGDRTVEATLYAQWRRLRLAENFTGYLANPDQGDLKEQRHQASTLGAGLLYERRLGHGFEWVLHGGARADAIAQSEDQLSELGIPWQKNRDLSALLLSGGLGSALRLRVGDLRAGLGARIDSLWMRADDELMQPDPESDGLYNLAPRLSCAYSLASGWTLFAGYGHGLRSPEARSAAVPEKDPSLHFTTSRSAEVGLNNRRDEALSFGLTGFGIWIENELVFDHFSGATLARNATRRIGLETYVAARPMAWLSLRADATAVSAKFIESGNPVPSAPRFLARAEAQARHSSGFRAGAQLVYMAPRPLAHGAEGAGFAVVDLIGRYRLEHVEFDLQIDNVLGSRWREGEFHFASRFDSEAPLSQLPRLHYSAGRPLGVRASLTLWF